MADEPLSYWMAAARMGFEDDFNRIFDELGISRTELAERLGTTPAYVSKILNGKAGNFQLETMTKMARALGAILQIRLIKEEGEVVRVVDYETARTLDSKLFGAPFAYTLSASSFGTVTDLNEFKSRRALSPDVRVKMTSTSKDKVVVMELQSIEENYG